MSRAAKATLFASVLLSGLTIWAVHYQQEQEREVSTVSKQDIPPTESHQSMYKGVLRDDERRREKMKQREQEYQESQQKRAIYERVQRVQPNGADAPTT